MGAAPAYSYYPERSYERVPERPPRQRISVVPGAGSRTESPALSPSVVFLAKAVAIVLVVVAVVAFARIGLASATVVTSKETQQISSQLDAARSSGARAEVSQSLLSNPTRVKEAATGLGMSAPEVVEIITLEPDVVVCDQTGALSLSMSAAAAAGTGA